MKLKLTIYRKYICHIKKDKPMLYVQLKKALNGMLQAALLFWKLLLDMLIELTPTTNAWPIKWLK